MKNQPYTPSASDQSRRAALKNIGMGIATSAFTVPLIAGDKDYPDPNVSTTELVDPIYYSSASALAGAIRERKVSCEEVTTAFLQRLNQVNPKINGVVQLVAEPALE